MQSRPSRKVKLRPCGWDALVAAAVIVLALLSGSWALSKTGEGSLTCVISVDGEEYGRYALSSVSADGETVTVGDAYSVTVDLTPDAVWVADATCPNHDCVHTGKITRGGQSIVCLPARVVIELYADDGQNDFDVVAE